MQRLPPETAAPHFSTSSVLTILNKKCKVHPEKESIFKGEAPKRKF